MMLWMLTLCFGNGVNLQCICADVLQNLAASQAWYLRICLETRFWMR